MTAPQIVEAAPIRAALASGEPAVSGVPAALRTLASLLHAAGLDAGLSGDECEGLHEILLCIHKRAEEAQGAWGMA